MADVVACQTCGQVQRLGELPAGYHAECARCGFVIYTRKANSRTRTAALALAALVLYFPANYYPIVTTYFMGVRQETTIFDGIRGLFQTGSYAVGCLIFTTSILTPALKIFSLLILSITANSRRFRKLRAYIYKMVQIIDPWNMLEVTMLAIFVATAELGKIATIHPGAGVFSFAAVVVLTIMATLTFDTRLVWDPPQEEKT